MFDLFYWFDDEEKNENGFARGCVSVVASLMFGLPVALLFTLLRGEED